MKRFGLALWGSIAVLGAALAGHPADALVLPNGSFTFSVPGPNTIVPPTNITSATTSITLSGAPLIGSFQDPFRTVSDNLCGAMGNGCLAQNAPGFLIGGDMTGTSSTVSFSTDTLPVGNTTPVPFNETVTATTADGTQNVDFDYTSIFTAALVPTTSTTAGTLTLDLLGTFGSNNTGVYSLGQSADLALACTQPSLDGAISCSATIDTPSAITPPVPEPASLALLGTALVGFGAFRRRRNKAA